MSAVTALIFAGGTGQRMSTRATPKQFLELHGKPVIIYTIEHFERHPEVDRIVVVCLESWIGELKRLLRRYDIDKVTTIVPGGLSGDASIYNGLLAMRETAADEDIVLIHDGVRPLIDEQLVSDNIAAAREHGAAITVERAVESVVRVNAAGEIVDVPARDEMYVAKAPQSFRYGLIFEAYAWAQAEKVGTIDSAHLCHLRGIRPRVLASTPNNMKITKPADYYIFRALYEVMENQQILAA
ncbi:MAG TPA: IspD/TarI family cytidylyltransferase [Solirubrobacteraceae bacterium]|nr:IspD/TarI family cytidylyltransferase [Solirubrobacteraceae bacterium]